MPKERLYPRLLVLSVTEPLVEYLASYCKQIRIAGSVRRIRPEVHDVEVLALCKDQMTTDLFGDAHKSGRSFLDDALDALPTQDFLGWRAVPSAKPGGVSRHHRLIHERTSLLCDLYIVADGRAWGSNLVVRTGPYGFSRYLMQRALTMGMFFADGFLLHGHACPPGPRKEDRCSRGGPTCPDIISLWNEVDVFEALKMGYVPPEARERKYDRP